MLHSLRIRKFLAKQATISRIKLNVFGTIMLVIGAVVGSYITVSKLILPFVYASDTTQSWTFATSSDYSLSDATLVEVAGSSARLKVRNYSSDANTAALFHLDESSGNPTDSSSNANSATHTSVTYASGNLNNAASFNGTSSQVSVADSSSLSLSQANTIEAWTKFGSTFNSTSNSTHQTIVDKGDYKLYYDKETGKITYELANASATSWTQQAGNDTKASWDLNGKLSVVSQTNISSTIYVGTGNAVGDAEVWSWNGTAWTKIGGDGLNSSWADQTYESVLSLATDGTNVYAGLGTGTGDGEVWKYNGTSWTRIAGDGINSGWAASTVEEVDSLTWLGTNLYAGTGNTAGDGDVWRWNGTSWTQIGGDALNSSWASATFERVNVLINDGTNVYAGLGDSTTDAEVWKWSGSAWTKIGGDGVNSSWNTNYEQVLSMTYMGTDLYAGIGNSTTDAEVWKFTSGAWSQVGGDGVSSSWNTNYEAVYALANDGTNVYAGLGNTAGDNEVWKLTSGTWSQIGGDAINSSFTNTHTIVQTLLYAGSTLYAGITSAGSSGESWSWNGTTWTRIGGNGVNSSWGFLNLQSVEAMTEYNGKLYAGIGNSTAGNAMVWEFNGTAWTLIGGQGVNSSWAANTYENLGAMTTFNGNLIIGMGTTAGDAEVWKYNGTTWTKIGGDASGSGGQSWGSVHEQVYSLAVYGGKLYVGLGNTAGDADVWQCTGTCTTTTGWSQVGGDTLNSSWASATYETVQSMSVYNNALVAGLGTSAGDAEVWSYNGTAWSKIGGDGTGSSGQSWATSTYENVDSLDVYNGKLYAGLGTGTDDAEVWQCSGSCTVTSGWTKVGGDGVNSSWATGNYERVRAMIVYDGDLYTSLGTSAGDAEVWKFNGTTWTQIGGDALNSSWAVNTFENTPSLATYAGKLYAGLGDTANADAAIWSYGNNSVLQSVATSQDTSWHHIAATYDGVTMKIYVDGVLNNSATTTVSLPDSSRALLIGTSYGSPVEGQGQGYFSGSIDELRISSSARSSFTTAPYSSSVQTVQPASAVFTSGINTFDSFSTSETLNGGSISYRLSSDGGTTWKYYSSGWTTSSSTSQANTASVINTNISTFPVTSGGILWQGILSGNGTQQVSIGGVTVNATADTTSPTAPSSLTALDSLGGLTSLTTNTWYTYSTPSFSWSSSTDIGGSGVAGYYVYLGSDITADPQTAGSFQVGSTYTASSLVSGTTYYLRIKAKDNAQNVSTTYSAFTYKYDSTAPGNPGVITVSPSGYTATNSYTFNWSTDATDGGSGIAGYQYKTGASSGALSSYSSTITSTYVTIASAAYQDGSNTFYLRTVDTAGNISATPLQATFYYAGSAPSAPRALAVNPLVNSTANSFAFSWSAPSSYVGSSSDLTYCYTVNVLPSTDNCTFTSAGATSLSASSFATQPGTNTFYLVAKDGTGNISYTTYASVEFTYSGSAPGIPRNLDVSDISIKSTSNWKLALTWDAPADVGAGVDTYKVYRSASSASCSDSFSSFTLKGSTSGTSFADAGLNQSTYYYCVKACDSANSCSAASSTKSGYPTGKFTTAAALSSGPVASTVTTKKAKIDWSTDRDSDSKVAYGTSPGTYLDSEPSNSDQVTDHSISLSNLAPGTTYYYKAKWTDEDGNTGSSEEKSFTTDPAPTVTDPKLKRAGLTEIDLEFKLKGASKVKIYFGETASFGGIKELQTSTVESLYTASIDKLLDGKKYFYKINTFDSEGSEYEGSILSFETMPRPKISTVRLQEVRGTAQTTMLVSWFTNTETSSIVTYYPEGNIADARDEVNVALRKDEHKIVLKSLLPQTNYVLVVKGRDRSGNEAQSEPQKFTTSTDTRPPQIADLRIEGSTIASKDSTQDQTAQLTISWNTDEPSTSQVEFGEGTGATYAQKTQEDSNLSLSHVVVISGLIPSKVYHLHAVNRDKAGNIGTSVDTVTITPKATDNALDLVLKNLQNIFGFLGSQK